MREIIRVCLKSIRPSGLVSGALALAIYNLCLQAPGSDQRFVSWVLVAMLGLAFVATLARESPSKDRTTAKPPAKVELWAADGKTKVAL